MANKEQLIEIFKDTNRWYEEEPKLAEAVRRSVMQTKVYMEEDAPALWEALKKVERNATGAGSDYNSSAYYEPSYVIARAYNEGGF